MIQNNLQGILGKCKKRCKFHSSGYYKKRFKTKNGCQTCIEQKYAIYNFKSQMYPERDQTNLS